MNAPSDDSRINELIEGHYLHSLSSAEQKELMEALQGSRSHRDRFRQAGWIDAQMRGLACREETLVTGVSQRRWIEHAVVGILLATSAVLALLLFRASGFEETLPVDKVVVQEADLPEVPIATLVDGSSFRFAVARELGEAMPPASYQLEEGNVELRFRNGVELTVMAPATFEIVSELKVALHRGRVWACVPEEGHGFLVAGPEVDIEDLGTEFGVAVGQDRPTQVHVFAGEVRVHQEGKSPELIEQGGAFGWQYGRRVDLGGPVKNAFVTKSDIGLRRWNEFSHRLQQDPAAVFYYDFERDSMEPKRLRNRAENGPVDGPIDGVVQGGMWTSGRWPDKGALLLEQAGDAVSLEVPDSHEQITLMGWLQMNRLDYPLQTIFSAQSRQQRIFRLEAFRNGGLRFLEQGGVRLSLPARSLQVGRWFHVAVVVNVSKHKAAFYLDGRKVAEQPWQNPNPLTLDQCSIGRSLHHTAAQGPYSRQLHARIDGLALFKREFSEDEIRSVHDAGKIFQWTHQTHSPH